MEEYICDYKNVGTVSYPKKFGNIKFPITNVYVITIEKSFNYLQISSPIDPSFNCNYWDWCINNGIMKINYDF